MATSRTGTTRWKKLREAAVKHARDNGLPCSECWDPIDFTLKTPHPGSPEADHIQEFRRGGRDVASNIRVIHRKCNLERNRRNRQRNPQPPPNRPTTSQEW